MVNHGEKGMDGAGIPCTKIWIGRRTQGGWDTGYLYHRGVERKRA